MTAGPAGRPSLFANAVAAALVAMLAAGATLHLFDPTPQSLWLDELWTVAATDPGLSLGRSLRQWILPDVHPPLYLLVVREWRLLFGDDEAVLRLLSGVFSLGLVASVPLVQRWSPVVREPRMLTAWCACSPAAIVYAHEARPYTLLLLLAAVATLLAVAIAGRMDRDEPVAAPCVALAGVVVVAEYSHYFGALIGAGVFAALAAFAATWHRRHLRIVLASGTAAVAVLLPWLALQVPRMSDKFGGHFWIANNWSTILPDAAALAAGSPELFVLIAGAIAAILIARPRLLRAPGCFVPVATMAPVLLGAAAISIHTPVVTPRNLIVLIPPFYVLAVTVLAEVAGGAGVAARVGGRLAAVGIVAASLGFAVDRLLAAEKDQWRQAAALVASLPGCAGTTVQVYYWPEAIYAHYLPPNYRHGLRTVWVRPEEVATRPTPSPPEPPCPLILWSGHMVGDYIVRNTLAQLGLARDEVIVRTLKGHMLILDRQRLSAGGARPTPRG